MQASVVHDDAQANVGRIDADLSVPEHPSILLPDQVQQHQPSFAIYGHVFEEKIFQALLLSPRWSLQMAEILRAQYFDSRPIRYLIEKYFKHYGKYRTFPTWTLLVTIVKDDLRASSDSTLRGLVIECLRRLKTNDELNDIEYVREKSFDFCRQQALREALEKAVDLIATEQFDDVVEVVKSALVAGTTPALGHDFFDDIDARFIRVNRSPVATNMHMLDQRTILNGGLGVGELGVIIGCAGIGKSHMLVMLGAEALKQGKNVLHYTFELSETAVGTRYDSYLCNIPSNDVFEHQDDIRRMYAASTYKKLIIKEYPTGSATQMTLKAHIDKLRLRSIVPDIIIIDYADVMRSTHKFDSLRHELKLVYEQLRNLAMELQVPIWTASQSNRSGVTADVVGLENISEAYSKAMVADVVLTLSRKPDEKATDAGRLYVAKNRFGRDGMVFNLQIDTSKSQFVIIDYAGSVDAVTAHDGDDMKTKLKEKWNAINALAHNHNVDTRVDPGNEHAQNASETLANA